MATARQIAANRRNAQRSTGPRTPEGKNNAKYNAFKHGLAANTILPHENLLEYHEIRAALIETWKPADAQEMLEVDNITMGWWCMQRANRFERRMFELQLQHMKKIHEAASTASHSDDDGGIVASFCNPDNEQAYKLLFRYDSRASSKYYRAIDHLMKLQARRMREERRNAQTAETKEVTTKLASFRAPAATREIPVEQQRETRPQRAAVDDKRVPDEWGRLITCSRLSIGSPEGAPELQ